MTPKYLLLSAALFSASVLSQPLSHPTNDWFAPLVSSDSAAIRLSSRPRSQVLRNEFMRLITTQFTIGLFCAPSYDEISGQSALIYYDENNTQHRTTDKELKCDLHYLELDPHATSINDRGDDRYNVQYGHVDTVSNQSFVIMESCLDNATDTTILAHSLLHRLSSTGEQLSLAASSLSEHQSDDIGHKRANELTQYLSSQIQDELSAKIAPDEVSGSNWQTVGPVVRSYDTWERYLWNAHKFGLGYIVREAPWISAKLVPAVESIRSKASDRSAELYTGYLDETQTIGGNADGKKVFVPKYVWFLVTTAGNKAIVYIVPNGGYAVDEAVCMNRCDATAVFCCDIGDFARKNTVELGKLSADKYSLL